MIGKWIFNLRACKAHRATFWRVLSTRPLIIYLQGSVKNMVHLHRRLAGRRAYFLRGPIFCEEQARYARRWPRYQRLARKYYPEHEVVLLTNTAAIAEAWRRLGADARFCNQNGLLDERLHVIHRGCRKDFDAVLNAQMEDFKRHELAVDVRNLALITYRIDYQPSYFERIRALLSHADWLNFSSGSYVMLPAAEVSRQVSRARVGLILSAVEGANYATVEYLLSGIPVVSTRCRGGREVFFDERCVRVVDDTPSAVAEGVRDLIARDLEPEFVRACVLERVLQHRSKFVGILQEFCDHAGVQRDVEAEWDHWFVNKMLSWKPLSELDNELEAAAARDGLPLPSNA